MNGATKAVTPEPSDETVEQRLPALWLVFIAVLVIWLVAGTAVWFSLDDLVKRGQFGDMFGAVNALFSGLAMAGVIYAVYLQRNELALQRKELTDQRKEMARTVGAQIRQLHVGIQSMAMECDDLAQVWAFTPIPELSFRQSAYINLVMSSWEMQLRGELLSVEQTKFVLLKYFKESKHFRAFWKQAEAHRQAMAAKEVRGAGEFHALAAAAYAEATRGVA